MEFATATGFEFIPRRRRGLAELAREQGRGDCLGARRSVLYIDGEKLFHPGMAKSRIAAYRKRDRKIC